ncbi:hypothetical protein Pmani_012510 [Petrolisthes manimaculis]|uniref:ubiquitinyl hydrolase 1 n=1 Tax=Petrolisthes manimaculis TaxID=1843537 RepID=A0AAE1UD50_9EUCA|nr:hypothetical protein Pmani_012510 [Petrolisthes manimaculis]
MASAQKRLVASAKVGDAAGVEKALQDGAWVDHVGSREGRAAIHYAAALGNQHLLHLLLAYAADPDIKSDADGEEGASPLHLAANVGNTDIMKLLLTDGANKEARDDRGKTALHWASLQGELTSLALLKKYGCNLEATVSGGGNALHYAAASGKLEVVQWLVEAGVPNTLKDKNNWLPKDVAKRNGHTHIHHFLKNLEKRSKKKVSKSSSSGVRSRQKPSVYRERSVDEDMTSSSNERLVGPTKEMKEGRQGRSGEGGGGGEESEGEGVGGGGRGGGKVEGEREVLDRDAINKQPPAHPERPIPLPRILSAPSRVRSSATSVLPSSSQVLSYTLPSGFVPRKLLFITCSRLSVDASMYDANHTSAPSPSSTRVRPHTQMLSSPPQPPTSRPRAGSSPIRVTPSTPPLSLPLRSSPKVTSNAFIRDPPPRKKKWVTLRSRSAGVKVGLRLQVEQLKEMLEEKEDLLQTRSADVTMLQEKVFELELEKAQLEKQLKETTSTLEVRTNHLQQGSSTLDSTPIPAAEERLKLMTTALEAEREDRTRERFIRREELLEANNTLEAERQLRVKEREAKDAEIAALTSELDEAEAKMRRYGVRQRRCLTRGKTVDDDLQLVGTPSGLPDLGSTSHINSVLQCLYSVEDLKEYFTSDAFRRDLNPSSGHGGEVAEAVAGVFKALRSGVLKEIETKMMHFKEVVVGVEDNNGKQQQQQQQQQQQHQDAHYLLATLLSALHQELGASDGSSYISELFHGSHESVLACDLTGEVLGKSGQIFTHLSLAVPPRYPSSLWAALMRTYGPQSMEWDCPHCQSCHLCRHQTTITRLPPVLIIHINRPIFQDQVARVQVTFPPRHLTLQEYATSSPSYELVGVVSHHGTLSSGHFTAFCRSHNDPTWRHYDDNQVTHTSLQRVLADTDAFLLLYIASTP